LFQFGWCRREETYRCAPYYLSNPVDAREPNAGKGRFFSTLVYNRETADSLEEALLKTDH
jgi:hypothetical protein